MTVPVFGCDRSGDHDSVANLKARHAPPPSPFFFDLQLPNSFGKDVGEKPIRM
jgi:hypothetical protein